MIFTIPTTTLVVIAILSFITFAAIMGQMFERKEKRKQAKRKTQKITELKTILPPEWLTVYETCETTSNCTYKRNRWLSAWLTQVNAVMPRLSMKTIDTFVQLLLGTYYATNEVRAKMTDRFLELPPSVWNPGANASDKTEPECPNCHLRVPLEHHALGNSNYGDNLWWTCQSCGHYSRKMMIPPN